MDGRLDGNLAENERDGDTWHENVGCYSCK